MHIIPRKYGILLNFYILRSFVEAGNIGLHYNNIMNTNLRKLHFNNANKNIVFCFSSYSNS